MTEETQYFTVEEANLRLPLIKRIVRDIVDLYKDVYSRRERLQEIRFRRSKSDDGASLYRDEVSEIEKELDRDVRKLEEFVEELRDLKVQLKDPARGLVDFPSMMDDREVLLCWELGEADVTHWHEANEGHAERQSLFEGSIPHSETESGDSEG